MLRMTLPVGAAAGGRPTAIQQCLDDAGRVNLRYWPVALSVAVRAHLGRFRRACRNGDRGRIGGNQAAKQIAVSTL